MTCREMGSDLQQEVDIGGGKYRRPQITVFLHCSSHWRRNTLKERKNLQYFLESGVEKWLKEIKKSLHRYKSISRGHLLAYSLLCCRGAESSTSKELCKPVLIAEHPSTKLFLQRCFKSSVNQHPPFSQRQQALSSSP